MTMPPETTRALIARLAAQAGPDARPRPPALPWAMAIAALLALAPVVLLMGVRTDLMPALAGIGGQKVVAGAVTALCAGLACREAARPDARARVWALLLPGVLAFVAPALLAEAPLPAGAALLADPAGPVCFGTIAALALLPLAVLMAGLRRTAPAHPAAAGLAAGALAAGLAACAYALHCTADTAGVASFWYPASVVATALLGSALGARLLAW
jgi:hypothetical protein